MYIHTYIHTWYIQACVFPTGIQYHEQYRYTVYVCGTPAILQARRWQNHHLPRLTASHDYVLEYVLYVLRVVRGLKYSSTSTSTRVPCTPHGGGSAAECNTRVNTRTCTYSCTRVRTYVPWYVNVYPSTHSQSLVAASIAMRRARLCASYCNVVIRRA